MRWLRLQEAKYTLPISRVAGIQYLLTTLYPLLLYKAMPSAIHSLLVSAPKGNPRHPNPHCWSRWRGGGRRLPWCLPWHSVPADFRCCQVLWSTASWICFREDTDRQGGFCWWKDAAQELCADGSRPSEPQGQRLLTSLRKYLISTIDWGNVSFSLDQAAPTTGPGNKSSQRNSLIRKVFRDTTAFCVCQEQRRVCSAGQEAC